MLYDKNTANLYMFDEVFSALITSIRRGKLEDAVFWAGEIDQSGLSDAMWKRFFTILTEDIGLSQPTLINQLNKTYFKWKKTLDGGTSESFGNEEAKKIVIEVLNILVSCPKSRLVYNATCFINSYEYPPNPSKGELPEVWNKWMKKYSVSDVFVDIDKPIKHFIQSVLNKDELNALFFSNFISLIHDNYDRRFIIDRTIDYTIKFTNIDLRRNCSLIIWKFIIDYITNIERNDILPIVLALYKLYIKKKGSSICNLGMAVILCIRLDNIEEYRYKEADIAKLMDIYNHKKRDYSIPKYAINKYTKRGNDVNTVKFLEKSAKTRKINISRWNEKEIAKSHGNGLLSNQSEKFYWNNSLKINNINKELVDDYQEDAEEFYIKMESILNKSIRNGLIQEYIFPILIRNEPYWFDENKNMKNNNILILDNDEDFKERIYFDQRKNVYFAKYEGENVIVKGVVNSGFANYACFVDELKPLFGLNQTGITKAIIGGDIYLIMKDFYSSVDNYKSKNGILDKSKTSMHLLSNLQNKKFINDFQKYMEEYIDILLFRQIIETGYTVLPDIIFNSEKENPLLSFGENRKSNFKIDKLLPQKYTKITEWKKIVKAYLEENKVALLKKLREMRNIPNTILCKSIIQKYNLKNIKIENNINTLYCKLEDNTLI
jgi:hypothetical protein